MTGPTVVVLDYGSGNLRSAERALARAGADVTVTASLADAAAADGLVVPGVGAFAACMAGIDALGAGPVIAARVAAGRPVLGICVGMQILFEYGDEHGVVTKGLGLLPGRRDPARRRRSCRTWAGTRSPRRPGRCCSPGSPADTRFYFVHSYAAHPAPIAGRRGRLGHHRRPRWSRSWPRSRPEPWPPPSSTRRSPATPGRVCCATGSAPSPFAA